MSLADGFPLFRKIREQGLVKTLQERRGTRLRGIYKEIVRAEAQVKAEIEAEKRRPKISVVMGGMETLPYEAPDEELERKPSRPRVAPEW